MMKVSIDLDSSDVAELKRARTMLDKLAIDAEARERHERKARAMPEERRALLRTSLADLDITARTRNALIEQGVMKLGDLVAHTAARLRAYPNIGAGSVKEVREALAALGLDLAPHEGRGRPMKPVKEGSDE